MASRVAVMAGGRYLTVGKVTTNVSIVSKPADASKKKTQQETRSPLRPLTGPRCLDVQIIYQTHMTRHLDPGWGGGGGEEPRSPRTQNGGGGGGGGGGTTCALRVYKYNTKMLLKCLSFESLYLPNG